MAIAPSRFAVRARIATALMLPAALLLGLGGCKHHRQSLRPVYVEPAPTAVAPCDPGTPGCDPGAPSVISPGSTSPGTTTSPAPANDEPRLEPADTDAAVPKATQRIQRRPATSRRATLRSRVAAFVDDPDDLFTPPKADRSWSYVVLHHSAHDEGGYAQIDKEHRERLGTDGCGYHFVIGNGTESPDGRIEVAKRWSEQKGGQHCRDAKSPDVNDYGIGIVLVGDLDDGEATPKQIEAARALVAYLRERYRIPADHVGTHAALASAPTACPGKHFPAQAITADDGLARR